MYIKVFGVSVHIGFLAAVAIAALLNRGVNDTLYASIAGIVIHEATHLFFMVLSGCSHANIEICPGGIRVSSAAFELLGYRRAVLCLLSAPCVNLILGAVFFILYHKYSDIRLFNVAFADIVLGTVNILPLSFLDGGRALEAIILCGRDRDNADRIKNIVDVLCLGVLFCFTCYIFLIRRSNYYLLAFCLYSALTLIFENSPKR